MGWDPDLRIIHHQQPDGLVRRQLPDPTQSNLNPQSPVSITSPPPIVLTLSKEHAIYKLRQSIPVSLVLKNVGYTIEVADDGYMASMTVQIVP